MPPGRKRVPSNAQAADEPLTDYERERVKRMKQDDYPNAIDLFKATHWSRKTGFSEAVKEAIAQMEAIVAEPAQEGQVPKTPTEAVAQVLGSTKFLQNAGLLPKASKKNAKSAVPAHVQELEAEVDELEAGVQSEKRDFAAVKGKIDVQQDVLETLQLKFEELEEAWKKQAKEIENLKKQGEETNSLLRRLLCPNKE